MRAIKESGGKTIVQDESSLIFGMPKAVIDAGFADVILPASEIANAVVKCISYGQDTNYEQRNKELCLTI